MLPTLHCSRGAGHDHPRCILAPYWRTFRSARGEGLERMSALEVGNLTYMHGALAASLPVGECKGRRVARTGSSFGCNDDPSAACWLPWPLLAHTGHFFFFRLGGLHYVVPGWRASLEILGDDWGLTPRLTLACGGVVICTCAVPQPAQLAQAQPSRGSPAGPEQDYTKVLQPVMAPGPAGVTSEKGPLLAPYCIADIPKGEPQDMLQFEFSDAWT